MKRLFFHAPRIAGPRCLIADFPGQGGLASSIYYYVKKETSR